jgi:CRISPR-associated endonuclease Cas3-HD
MFFAHSIEGRDREAWQPLAEHLHQVARLTSLRADKFGAGRLGAVIGLLHDLGKYSREFQDYISGQGPSPDHATAGARELPKHAADAGPDRFAALIGTYCIAGHHSGLPLYAAAAVAVFGTARGKSWRVTSGLYDLYCSMLPLPLRCNASRNDGQHSR